MRQSQSAPLGCVRPPIFSRRAVFLPGRCCLQSINQPLRSQHKVAHWLQRFLVRRRSRPGSLHLRAMSLLQQFPGCAQAFHRVGHRRPVSRGKKRSLLKLWRVPRNRNFPSRSLFRCPMDWEARSIRSRASFGTLQRQKFVGLSSCFKPMRP